MDDVKISDNTKFSLIKRAKSLTHAGRGIWIFIKTTHNAWVHIFSLIVAITLGIFFKITYIEWMILFLTAGLVFVTEAINTAIEIDINLTSPQYHPYARDTKDVAAGAVLLAGLVAALIGILIFGKHIIDLF